MSATPDEIEHDKIRAEIAKLIAETSKINAEARKIASESRWYPFIAVAGVFAAAVGFVKLFL